MWYVADLFEVVCIIDTDCSQVLFWQRTGAPITGASILPLIDREQSLAVREM